MTPQEKARDLIRNAHRIVAFTGSGISAESGIPTFRGEGGIWNTVSVEEFGTPQGVAYLLTRAPDRLLRYLSQMGELVLKAQPNPAHLALAHLEKLGKLLGVITQNVDDLHEQAGTKTVFKLHGDLFRWRCLHCSHTFSFTRQKLLDLLHAMEEKKQIVPLLPRCSCGGFLRPDVVLFGEALPSEAIAGSIGLLQKCDLLLIVGTSGVVEPAASLARQTLYRGVPAIEINRESTPYSSICSVSLLGKAGEILPQLIR